MYVHVHVHVVRKGAPHTKEQEKGGRQVHRAHEATESMRLAHASHALFLTIVYCPVATTCTYMDMDMCM